MGPDFMILLNVFILGRIIQNVESIKASYYETDFCDPKHQNNVFLAMEECKPRPTLVELPLPESKGGAILQVIPGHVMVDRCAGSCHSYSHSCMPTKVDNTSMEVMAIQTTYSSGIWNTICAEILVERHVECGCACPVRAEHCTKAQFYDWPSCKCRCRDQVARHECQASGKHWNAETCSCVCPKRTWSICTTGSVFDFQNTCDCVRTYALASGGGIAIVVAIFAIFCLGMSGLVFHLKKRQQLVARRQNMAEFLTEEALR